MSRIKRMLLVTTALLAPLAAWADIATPPNDYTGFLYRGGHYVGGGGSGRGALALIVTSICVSAGVCLLWWACCRRRTKKAVPMEYVVLTTLVISSAICLVIIFGNEASKALHTSIDSDSWPRLLYKDTQELRAEYDQKCIEYYESYEAPTNWPEVISYRLGKDAPIMRPDAPEAVTNAYLRYREELKRTRFVK